MTDTAPLGPPPDRLAVVRGLFSDYQDRVSLGPPEAPQVLRRQMGEVAWKLDQLLVLLQEIRQCEAVLYEDAARSRVRMAECVRLKDELTANGVADAGLIAMDATRDPAPPDLDLLRRAALFAECFYYVAFRCGRLASRLPDFGHVKFKGINQVRNKLIEHSDGKDMLLFSSSSGWDPTRGVVLRSSRSDDETEGFRDEGFNANLNEFVGSLEQLLSTDATPNGKD